ncbi:hypothetical protein ACOME3_001857 [Neoechinorhynchus agilis]
MRPEDLFLRLRERLARSGQVQLLSYWTELNDSERTKLYEQLESLDIEQLHDDFLAAYEEYLHPRERADIEPVPETIRSGTNLCSRKDYDKYWTMGLRAIKQKEVAAVVMAGGQGTRLGVSYPKGMYDVDLPSKKSLFQLQAERITRLKELVKRNEDAESCEIHLPWFIMTSDHTMAETRTFFEKHNFFGHPKSDIFFFEQDEMPSFTKHGKIILSDKCTLFKAPDGNGGLFKVLKSSGMLDEMARLGIKYVHAYCVDNILVRVADPVFIGYCIDQESDCAVKVVLKEEPNESVGVVCHSKGKYQIVEYSELPDCEAHKRETSGRLAFRDGNICNHFFTVDFLNTVADRLLANEFKMTNHPAIKNIPSIDGTVQGLKLEKFVFDVIPLSQKFVIWQVERKDEFAPLKNGPNSGKIHCTPQSCKEAIFNTHRKWITESLSTKEFNNDMVEVSPLVSYCGEGLDEVNEYSANIKFFDGQRYVEIERNPGNGNIEFPK